MRRTKWTNINKIHNTQPADTFSLIINSGYYFPVFFPVISQLYFIPRKLTEVSCSLSKRNVKYFRKLTEVLCSLSKRNIYTVLQTKLYKSNFVIPRISWIWYEAMVWLSLTVIMRQLKKLFFYPKFLLLTVTHYLRKKYREANLYDLWL